MPWPTSRCGISATRRAKFPIGSRSSRARVTPSSRFCPTLSSAANAYAAGARGLLLRDADGQALAGALAATRAGLVALDPIVAEALVPTREPTLPALELTPRESQVLGRLSDGLSNKEIAAKMWISDHTVKFHVNAILQKLGASTRTEAVVSAARRGLITL